MTDEGSSTPRQVPRGETSNEPSPAHPVADVSEPLRARDEIELDLFALSLGVIGSSQQSIGERRGEILSRPAVLACVELGSSEDDIFRALAIIEQRQGQSGSANVTAAELMCLIEENNEKVAILTATLESLQQENDFLREQFCCKVCRDLEKVVQVIFMPCGHFVCCRACSERLTNCPICRVTVTQRVDGILE